MKFYLGILLNIFIYGENPYIITDKHPIYNKIITDFIANDLNNSKDYSLNEIDKIYKLIELMKKYDIPLKNIKYEEVIEICSNKECTKIHVINKNNSEIKYHQIYILKDEANNNDKYMEILNYSNKNDLSFVTLLKYIYIIPEEDKKLIFSENDINKFNNTKIPHNLLLYTIYYNKIKLDDFYLSYDHLKYKGSNPFGFFLLDYFNKNYCVNGKYQLGKIHQDIFLPLKENEKELYFENGIIYKNKKYIQFSNKNLNELQSKFIEKISCNYGFSLNNINNFNNKEYLHFYNSLCEFTPGINLHKFIILGLFGIVYFCHNYILYKQFFKKFIYYIPQYVWYYFILNYSSIYEKFSLDSLLVVNGILIFVPFTLINIGILKNESNFKEGFKNVFDKGYIIQLSSNILIYNIYWYFITYPKSNEFITGLHNKMKKYNFYSIHNNNIKWTYNLEDDNPHDKNKIYNLIEESEIESFYQEIVLSI